jgi:hypothetical protein
VMFSIRDAQRFDRLATIDVMLCKNHVQLME